jgi:hypothetical protein
MQVPRHDRFIPDVRTKAPLLMATQIRRWNFFWPHLSKPSMHEGDSSRRSTLDLCCIPPASITRATSRSGARPPADSFRRLKVVPPVPLQFIKPALGQLLSTDGLWTSILVVGPCTIARRRFRQTFDLWSLPQITRRSLRRIRRMPSPGRHVQTFDLCRPPTPTAIHGSPSCQSLP